MTEYHPFRYQSMYENCKAHNAALLLNRPNFSSASGMGLNKLQLCSEREIAHAKNEKRAYHDSNHRPPVFHSEVCRPTNKSAFLTVLHALP